MLSYLIINGKGDELKRGLLLKNGVLDCKKSLKYLGVLISDSGNIKDDVLAFVQKKRCSEVW